MEGEGEETEEGKRGNTEKEGDNEGKKSSEGEESDGGVKEEGEKEGDGVKEWSSDNGEIVWWKSSVVGKNAVGDENEEGRKVGVIVVIIPGEGDKVETKVGSW
jgi:hypothetical protein